MSKCDNVPTILSGVIIMNQSPVAKRLGYLSGAPRVSTHPQAEVRGARSHVLGVIHAFEALGWQVTPFIVGDRVPKSWVNKGSENAISSSFLKTLAVDLIRITMAVINSYRSWRELEGKVDFVYERLGSFQSLGYLFKKHNIPWILETNALLYYEAKIERNSLVLSKIAQYLEIQAYRKCDVLICVSYSLKEMIIKEAEISPDKVLVVPNGVDTEYFNPATCQPVRMFKEFTLGFMGGLFPWQALDLLIKAISELDQENGIQINLIVIGDGKMRISWEALSDELGLTDRIKFLGWLSQPDLLPLISGVDMGFSGHVDLQGGSIYRSPLKIYEYMALGIPVITSEVEDAKCLIRDHDTGFVFKSGEIESLKSTLLKAYNFRNKLGEMGANAREEVVANHSWTSRIQILLRDVEDILQSQKLASSKIRDSSFLFTP
jgi:glycosyltransferase involved in cell wall biosynthesis